MEQWIQNELEWFQVRDRRLQERAKHILSGQYANPTKTFYGSAGSEAAAKATYRFQKNPAVEAQALLDSHLHQVTKRMADHRVVLCVNDTTQLPFPTQSAKENRGTLGPSPHPNGYLLHPLVAFTPHKLCLGVLQSQFWSRPPEDYGKKKKRGKKPVEDKESIRWLQAYRHTTQLQKTFPKTRLIYVADREADLYELLLETQAPESAGLIVRATHDRKVNGEQKRLREHLQAHPHSFSKGLSVPRRGSQPARQATLEVSFDAVEFSPPRRKTGDSIALGAVLVRELCPPKNAKALNWLLLTTEPLTTRKDVCRVIDAYTVRWQIEVFFRTLKTGCRIENDQTHRDKHFKINLAFKLIVTWRILYTSQLFRSRPEDSCAVLFEPEEWKTLWCRFESPQTLPRGPPQLKKMVVFLARLGGYKQWKKDQVPGAQVLWNGYSVLQEMTNMFTIFQDVSKV